MSLSSIDSTPARAPWFLRAVGTTVALVMSLATCTGTQAADENKYESQALGISVVKPQSWHFLSTNDVLDRAKLLKLGDPETDKRWREAMRAPLVTMAKYSSNLQGFNPSFRLDAKPYGAIPAGSSGSVIVNAVVAALKANFKEVEVEKGPVEVTVKGQNAGYVKFNYVNVSTTGYRLPTTAELWAVPKSQHYFMLGGSYPTGDAKVAEEMAAILDTVSFE